MLIVRSPMRISFAGGGTDFPGYYERFGGMVVSAAIDKYVYVIVSPTDADSLQISSSDYSTFFRHSGDQALSAEGKLRYARVFLRKFGIRTGYSLFMASEMPPGTGLGSSSSLAVALTKALAALSGEVPPKAEVARQACETEMEELHMPIGKQDQYAATFGGINALYFSKDGVRVEPLDLSNDALDVLTHSVMLFFTEQAHDSAEILAAQSTKSREQDAGTMRALAAIREHATLARAALLAGDVEQLGRIMNDSWQEKKKLAPGVTNSRIDQAYAAALGAGAIGGKIAGAGGGGFLMVVCPPANQDAVSSALDQLGLVRSNFRFDSAGARILLNNVAA